MTDVQPITDYLLGPFLIANISAASQSQKLAVPMKGQIVSIDLCQAAQTTTATGTLTVRKNGTAMTGCTLTVPIAAAGTVTNQAINPNLTTGDVHEGDELDIDTDGGTTGAGAANVMVRIRR